MVDDHNFFEEGAFEEDRDRAPSNRLMLAPIANMIELVSLQIGARRVDVGQGGFAQYIGGDVLDRAIRDFMNEADVRVFAGRDPRDDLATGDFRVDDGLRPRRP